MSTKVIVPKIGTSTAPLALVEWLANEGDWVKKGSTILVVESEKIRHDVEARASGFIHILVEAGNEAPIGSSAGLITDSKKELVKLQKEMPKTGIQAATRPENETPQDKVAVISRRDSTTRVRISPAARKLAEEHTIDILKIAGTGPDGAIQRKDVERLIKAEKASPSAKTETEKYEGRKLKTSIPLLGMKKAIAEHMHRSITVSAHVNLMGEIDMLEMKKLREKLLEKSESLGIRISYTDLIVFVLSRILKDHPFLNSSLMDDEIKLWETVNIGVAVGYEGGLVVPVVKDADKKSLTEISKIIKILSQKARDAKLTSEEITGGTFTISNVGPLGVGYRFDTDIINQPEAAILGTSGITDRAVVRDNQIVIRPIMTYSLTYDHRVTEGFTVCKFTNDLERTMENPLLLFTRDI